MLKKIGILVGLFCITFGLFSPVALVASPIIHLQRFYSNRHVIWKITRDMSTPEKKAEAVVKLMAIVENPEESISAREDVAEYLGEIEAVQAEDMLKDLAETLPWSSQKLKQFALLAYWKIKVVSEPNEEKQNQLLIQLLHETFKDGYNAGDVQHWAVDELANRGVKEALPEIIKRWHGDEQTIWLYTTKTELRSTSASREEALGKALAIYDPRAAGIELKRWATEGLAALNTEGARIILVNFALGLQNKYYNDETDRWIPVENDRLSYNAYYFFNDTILKLRTNGMTDDAIRNTGIRLRVIT